MWRAIGRSVTIVALCSAIGMPWMLLQPLAWATMLIEYSKHTALRQAIEQTFDGAHPCKLCKGISAAQHSSKKCPAEIITPKLDLICATTRNRFIRHFQSLLFLTGGACFYERKESPPVPPPRFALS